MKWKNILYKRIISYQNIIEVNNSDYREEVLKYYNNSMVNQIFDNLDSREKLIADS